MIREERGMIGQCQQDNDLILELSQALFPVYPGIYESEAQQRLADVIVQFDIRRIDPDEAHPDLFEKIDLFLDGKKLEGLSKITLDSYRVHLRIFAGQIRKKTGNVSTTDIRSYLGQFSGQKISTLSTKLSVLKSFFGWLTAEEVIPKDPTFKIKPPKKERRLPKALTIEELELLRENCKTIRQRTMVEVMYATGCRLSEVQRMNRSDIDFGTQTARVIGKGNKERIVCFSFKAIYHIRKYLVSRTDNDPALFVTERRPFRRLTRRGIQREIGLIAANAGLQKRVSPHTLRHTFATLTLNNGAELVAVQELLGHEDPATTQIYASISPERKREQHKKHLVQ